MRHGEDAAFRVLSLTEEIERQVASQASLKVRMDRLRIERDRAQNMVIAVTLSKRAILPSREGSSIEGEDAQGYGPASSTQARDEEYQSWT